MHRRWRRIAPIYDVRCILSRDAVGEVYCLPKIEARATNCADMSLRKVAEFHREHGIMGFPGWKLVKCLHTNSPILHCNVLDSFLFRLFFKHPSLSSRIPFSLSFSYPPSMDYAIDAHADIDAGIHFDMKWNQINLHFATGKVEEYATDLACSSYPIST